MNRELKFRVWDKVEFMYRFTLNELVQKKIEFSSDCPVMQFTGLKDKNGKEIYEGDIILAHERNANHPLKYVIVFNTEETGFKMRWEGRLKESGFYDERISVGKYKVFEVIGNIYENPDLLKQL